MIVKKEEVIELIKGIDELFDGRYSPGGGFVQDKEFAYHEMRLLALELLESLDE